MVYGQNKPAIFLACRIPRSEDSKVAIENYLRRRYNVPMRQLSRWCRGLLAVLLVVQMSGCVVLVAGTVGAVGGYALTRDTIQGEYDARYEHAWKSAVKVCGVLGTVTLKDSSLGMVQAMVDGANVRVEVTQLTTETARVKVKARKGIFPRMGTAEKVFVKIVQDLM